MKFERIPGPDGSVAVAGHGNNLPQTQYHPTPHGYDSGVQEDEIRFDLLKILWLIVHYRWVISGMMLAGVVLGVLFTWSQTPLYRSTAKLEIVTGGAKVLEELEAVSNSGDLRVYETAREKLRSRDLARRVVYELNLSENTEFLTPTASFSLVNVLSKAIGSSPTSALNDSSAEERERLAIEAIQRNLTASLIRNTSVLDISMSHPNAELSAKIANQTAKSFLDQSIDSRSETSNLAVQFVQQQVIETKKKLESSEIALVNYAKEAGITATGEDGSLISQNIAKINESISKAIADRLIAERNAIQVKEGNASALPQISDNKSIQETRKQIIALKATYQEKRATLKPGFPEMRRLQAQINEFTRQYNAEIAALGRSVEIAYRQSLEQEKALRAELAELEVAQAAYQEKNINYTILKREVDSNRTQYGSLIEKLNEVRVGAVLKTSNINIIEQATVPINPYSPRLVLNTAITTLLFLMLAGALILVFELLNNTFSTPDQVESDLGLPVLGIIPFVSGKDIQEQVNDDASTISESYRTLRTSLQFTGLDDKMKTIAVTSAEPSEGKSTTVYKLAIEFAALGNKVLVIDADLRKPKMHKLFRTDNRIGLSNLLSNVVPREATKDIFRPTNFPNIMFMAAGTIPPNPTDLLASQKMGMLMPMCAEKYDMVIFDASPVMGLSDAPILARNVDAVLMVVSTKQVPRRAAKEALKRLRASGANVVGAAMSKFLISKTDYNYAYRYMSYNYLSYEVESPKLENQSTHDSPDKSSGTFANAFAWVGRFSRRFG